jgi:signal transduction histidine kinase
VTAGFGAALLAVVAGGGVSAETMAVRRANTALVTHTLSTVNALENVIDVISTAESSQRGFLITEDRRYLQPYEQALNNVGPAMAYLRENVADDPVYLKRVDGLEFLVRRRLAELEQVVRAQREHGHDAAQRVAATDEGMHLMERIRGRIHVMQRDQQRLLQERQEAWSRAVSLSNTVLAGANVMLLGLIVVAAILVRRELSAREEREKERGRMVELQQQLMGIVGHDLRGPLTAIMTGAQLLSRTKEIPEARRPAVQRILSSARRMERLIRDLLDFTRVRLGSGIPVSRRWVDLATVCHKVADEIQMQQPAQVVDIQFDGDLGGQWDSDRLAQVVQNLLANAVRHGGQAGPVTLRARANGTGVVLEVHNGGAPIPSDVRTHLFEPFHPGGNGRQGGSVGLGLFIVKSIVEAHQGTVEVRSEEGEGTTFRVWLPKGGRNAG